MDVWRSTAGQLSASDRRWAKRQQLLRPVRGVAGSRLNRNFLGMRAFCFLLLLPGCGSNSLPERAPHYETTSRRLGLFALDQFTGVAPRPFYTPPRVWIDRLLFPRSSVVNRFLIGAISVLFSVLLTGKQISPAKWGLIDDHETFELLLSRDGIFEHVWTMLLDPQQVLPRNRPIYYLLKAVQTSLFGFEVRYWYLRNTLCFAFFLSAIWWITARFVGAWLGGALTAMIALLPLWAGIWSRLGPSEIEGAAVIAAFIFCADAVMFCEGRLARNIGAVLLAMSAMMLAGLKETFLPLAAGGTTFVLALAVLRKRISLRLAIGLIAIGLLSVAALGVLIWTNARATGTDYYGRSVGLGLMLEFATIGMLDGLARTWWLWLLPIALAQLLQLTPRRTFREWVAGSQIAVGTYVFFIAMYAAQCGLYRGVFPRHMRYDFPAMLLVPLTFCILCCEISRWLRDRYPDDVVNRAQLITAIFVGFAAATSAVQTPPPLLAAIDRNVRTTSSFFAAVQDIVQAAKENPGRPIVLEGYGARSYEGVLSINAYLAALGASNPVTVRYHAVSTEPTSPLQKALADLEGGGSKSSFSPLAETLIYSRLGCMSIGLYGPPDPICVVGFTLPVD